MGKEEELLEQWRELTPEKQQKVWQFVQILKSESQTTPEAKFIPQTPLSKKLWEIRQRAILAGLQLLNEDEIEQELPARQEDAVSHKKAYIDSGVLITAFQGIQSASIRNFIKFSTMKIGSLPQVDLFS
jgi:hypothetical protein